MKWQAFASRARGVETSSSFNFATKTRPIKAFSYSIRGWACLIWTCLAFAADHLMLIDAIGELRATVRIRALVW